MSSLPQLSMKYNTFLRKRLWIEHTPVEIRRILLKNRLAKELGRESEKSKNLSLSQLRRQLPRQREPIWQNSFIYAGVDKQNPPLSRRFLARLKEFESPTFRLGGGRSILLSYKRIYDIVQTDYLLPFCKGVC